jgi:tRNA(Ile)-lysidine synthase
MNDAGAGSRMEVVSVSSLLECVAESIGRGSLFLPAQRVGVAVSGGADSVCLLHVLAELAPRWALRLSVLHLNHRLRGEESRLDEEFVRSITGRMGLPCHVESADIRRMSEERGDNLEQVARQVRRDFFLRFLLDGLLDRVALGHTRSDQAETVLFRLLRGAGTAGLRGILPVTAEGFVRPLLELDRAEVEQFLTERGIPWREDSSNRSLEFARNRIRHELLPSLTRDWNPALAENLARMAVLAGEDEEYWLKEMNRLAERYLVSKPPAVLLRVEDLAGMDQAVRRRLVRRAFELVKGDLRRIEFVHVDKVLSLAGARDGDGRVQVPGLDIFRSFGWIRFAPAGEYGAPERSFSMPVAAPGRFRIPKAGALSLQLLEKSDGWGSPGSGYNESGDLDWNRIRGPLELRNWRPGDQYRPSGHARGERIKFFFQQARIPLWERRGWPVLIGGETIVWARRFGAAAEFAATRESRMVLRVTETEDFADCGNLTDVR